MAHQNEYRRSGVDYQILDDVKTQAIGLAAATSSLMGSVGGTEIRNRADRRRMYLSWMEPLWRSLLRAWEPNPS